jgi:hypothetical protein
VRIVGDIIAVVVLQLVALGAVSTTSRVRFARLPGAFRCRLGTPQYPASSGETRWRLRRTRARWVSDVLVVQSGFLRLGATPMAARIATGAVVRTAAPLEVRGLGRRPASLLLSVEDRGTVEVAVAEADRFLLVGPYLAAGLSGLPRAPRERGA